MHPALGGGFGPGHRVAFGYDFTGDSGQVRSDGMTLVLHPDPDPRDTCEGALQFRTSLL